MDWKQIGLNLLIIVVFYALGYGSSYFFSKRYAEKRIREKRMKNKK